MNNWQPIENAPKDRRILAYGKVGLEPEAGIATVKWCDTWWVCDPNEASEYMPERCDLTHWMPLPDPPK
jgi:hypothetical protein